MRALFKIIKRYYIALLVIVFISGLFVYKHYNSESAISMRNIENAKEMTNSTIKSVGKLMVLPLSEEPMMFDVKDPVLLTSQQPFFAGSVEGDKLLVYQKAGKAIIYSPSKDMIVNVGPINFDAPAAPSKTSADIKVDNTVKKK